MGLSKDQTMAIGDAENDRAMLEAVGNPVVMEMVHQNSKKSLNILQNQMKKWRCIRP